MKVLGKIRDIIFGTIITMVLLVTPVFAGGPMDEPTEIVTESETITEESSAAEKTRNDSGIYTIRIDLGDQWAGAKFYLDTDSGRVEYIADLLGGVSFKVTGASESYTLSPKIQAPPSANQEVDESLEESKAESNIDSTENVGVIDGSSIGSIEESSEIRENLNEDNSEINQQENEEESLEEDAPVIENSNGGISIDPVSETEEVLHVTIIILSVIAIGAVLGLIISRVIAAVKKKGMEKAERANESAEEDGADEVQEENEEDDDDEEEEEDEI